MASVSLGGVERQPWWRRKSAKWRSQLKHLLARRIFLQLRWCNSSAATEHDISHTRHSSALQDAHQLDKKYLFCHRFCIFNYLNKALPGGGIETINHPSILFHCSIFLTDGWSGSSSVNRIYRLSALSLFLSAPLIRISGSDSWSNLMSRFHQLDSSTWHVLTRRLLKEQRSSP